MLSDHSVALSFWLVSMLQAHRGECERPSHGSYASAGDRQIAWSAQVSRTRPAAASAMRSEWAGRSGRSFGCRKAAWTARSLTAIRSHHRWERAPDKRCAAAPRAFTQQGTTNPDSGADVRAGPHTPGTAGRP